MLSRRHFLFCAPAIVAVTSIMPVRVPKLEPRPVYGVPIFRSPAIFNPGMTVTGLTVMAGDLTARRIVFPGGVPVPAGEMITAVFDGKDFVALEVGRQRIAA